MAQEIKVAKILTRTGLKASLPQPLSPGEFGTALDTGEVFIGLNPTNTSANNALPIINCYASVVDSQTYANQLISTYLFQVDLSNPSITNTDIDLANDDNVTAGFTRRYVKVAGRLYISYEYKYTSSVLDIPSLPNTGLGTEALLSVATGMSFANNSLDLSLLGTYTWQDTSAIASLMNFSFTPSSGLKSGIVNVEQNLRLLTESDLASMQTDNVPTISVNGIKNLQPAANAVQYVIGFYENSVIGSGNFKWDAAADKALHDGGTIIAPEALNAWDGSQSNLNTLLNWSGTGNGCFVRLNVTFVSPEMFGAIGTGTVDDTSAIAAAHATQKSVVYKPNTSYLITKTNVIQVYDGCKYLGNFATLIVSATTIPSDTVGLAGRYNSGVFYRAGVTPVTEPITIEAFLINCNSKYVNFIYLTDARSIRDNHIHGIFITECYFTSLGEEPGTGGYSGDTELGGLLLGHGYIIEVSNSESRNCGQGIMALGSKRFVADNFRSYFCGVSQDFTTWRNAASLLVRSSEHIAIRNCFSYVNGGSCYFVSQDGNELTKRVVVHNNILIGCGFSGISAGARTYTPVAADIEFISIVDNKILGFCCGIGSDLHSGIKASLESDYPSVIRELKINNDVDYLAPWETFNDTTGDVDGSYNTKKKVGQDVGSQFSVTVIMGENDRCYNADIICNVYNHQKGGLVVENIDFVKVKAYAYNCGWSRNLSNAPWQIQQPIRVTDCGTAYVDAITKKTCYMVVANQDWCSPVYLSDNLDVTVSVHASQSGPQFYALRIQNFIDGCKTTITELVSDVKILDAGYTYLIDLTAGPYSKNHDIYSKLDVVNFISGSRQLPVLVSKAVVQSTDMVARNITLERARLYKNRELEFVSNYASANSLTVTAFAGEFIDGSPNIVIAPGQRIRLYSNGTGWQRA